jgi:hypothetical protein
VAQSKKIWFTEYGFPSVDGAANQPNVFYAPGSSESAFPRFSKGRVDLRAQRTAIMATENQWAGSSMVERMFLWTWDARPFPYWPDLQNIWRDGGAWKTGHWVNGKMGISGLAGIVRDLCLRAGLNDSQIDVTRLNQLVTGMVLTQPTKVREAIESLQAAYFFDLIESDGLLKALPRKGVPSLTIPGDSLIPNSKTPVAEPLALTRAQEIELPQIVHVQFFNPITNYQPSSQSSQRETVQTQQSTAFSLPLVLSEQEAKIIADSTLYRAWVERTRFRLSLPVRYAALEPGDVITVTTHGIGYTMRLTRCWYGKPGVLEVEAVAEDASAYDFYTPPSLPPILTQSTNAVVESRSELLDLPALPNDDPGATLLYVASCGKDAGWRGAVLYRSDDGGSNYIPILTDEVASVVGVTTTLLASGTSVVIDETNSVDVAITGPGQLASAANLLALYNGGNTAVIGEEIVQFRDVILLSPGLYRLKGLLRGRLGSEWAMSTHAIGERFVLLDGTVNGMNVPAGMVGLQRHYKMVSVGATLGSTSAQTLTYSARALKPLSPVRIKGTRDGSGNLTLNWIRRTRGGGQWQDNIDVPLNEASEAYEVEIMNGVNVIRTLTGLTTPTATYTSAQQASDFGSPQASVSVRIYQISTRVGRGDAGAGSV